MKTFEILSEAEMRTFAGKVADSLKPGNVVALIGDLGTGKTTLTKYIAAALGVKETVTSPTFNIVKEYHSGRLPLYHFDVYRIGSSEDMFEIGCEEYFFGDGVSVIEWADLIEEILPENTTYIHIYYGESPESRRIELLERG